MEIHSTFLCLKNDSENSILVARYTKKKGSFEEDQSDQQRDHLS